MRKGSVWRIWVAALVALSFSDVGGAPASTANADLVSADVAALTSRLREIIAAEGLTGRPEGSDSVPRPLEPLPSLGRALFFSTQLSGQKDVACITCHHPLAGGGDALSLPVGIAALDPDVVGPGRVVDLSRDGDPRAKTIGGPNVPRNSLSTFNSGFYRRALLHDGRISLLGEGPDGAPLFRTPDSSLRNLPDPNAMGDLLAVQSRFPVTGFEEMRGFGEFYELSGEDVRDRIAMRIRSHAAWLPRFQLAFRAADPADKLITFDNISLAISAYQRSQTFVDHPWSRFVSGEDAAISRQAKEGALLFHTAAADGGLGCSGCHAGDFFTDEVTHVAGFPQLGRGKRADADDPGAYLVSQKDVDRYGFRTPTLLNVTATGPWGHAGAFATLAELVGYHSNAAIASANYDYKFRHLPQFQGHPDPYPAARELTMRAVARLSDKLPGRSPSAPESQALVAFLQSLTDPCVTSRICLQPWMAVTDDNLDGMALQPSFRQFVDLGNVPHHVNSTSPSAPALIRAALPAPDPAMLAATRSALIRCGAYKPRVPGEGRQVFVDRGRDLGLQHEHHVPAEMWYGRRYSFTVEFALANGPVAASDLNGDCWPDLLFGDFESGEALVRVYWNRAGASFDADKLDLAELPDAIGSLGLADLNGDYQIDLAVGNLFGGRESVVYQSLPDARLKAVQRISMSKGAIGFAFGDIAGDAAVDVFVAHWDIIAKPARAPAMMENRGGFLYPVDDDVGTSGADLEQNFHFSPGFVDIDLDGDLDLTIASDFGTSEVLRNDDGRFDVITDRAVINDENGMGSAIGDFNNDGVPDWFVTAIRNYKNTGDFKWGISGNRLYLGDRTASTEFRDATEGSGVRDGAWGWGACAADFNNDGWLDLFHENGFGAMPDYARSHIPDYMMAFLPANYADFHTDHPRLFINKGINKGTNTGANSGDVRFEDESAAWGLDMQTNGRGVVCVDYDRDGDIDVVLTENVAAPRLLENRTRGLGAARFIGFHVLASPPNTQALGATLTLKAGGMTQQRQVLANSNYQSQNPATIHFGVGSSEVVTELHVRWPDGIEETLADIPTDQYYPLLHPQLRSSGK